MLSKTCEYAIRAMMFIAQKSKDGEKVGMKAIAKGTGSPEHFIAKILQELGLEHCSEKKPCSLHDEFKGIREKIKIMLQTAKVGEFDERLDLGLRFLKR